MTRKGDPQRRHGDAVCLSEENVYAVTEHGCLPERKGLLSSDGTPTEVLRHAGKMQLRKPVGDT